MAKKKWIIILLILLAAFLALWCLIPRNTFGILDVERDQVSRAYVTVMDSKLMTIDSYQVNTEDLDSAVLSELLDILEGKGCRSDIRNLLPWKTQSLTAQGNHFTVSVSLTWGSDPEKACHLSFLKPKEFSVSRDGGFDVYHPADKETMEKLYGFAVTYGEKK